MMILFMSSACTIGIKRTNEVVYVGFDKPSTHKGKIKIATNKKIKATVGDKHVELDLGGYIAIKETDLDRFIDMAIELQEAKKNVKLP